MEKTTLVAVIVILLAISFPISMLQAEGLPGEEDMVKQRLRMDLRELRRRYNQLSEKCARYKKKAEKSEDESRYKEKETADTVPLELKKKIKTKNSEITRLRRVNRKLNQINMELETELVNLQEKQSSETSTVSAKKEPRTDNVSQAKKNTSTRGENNSRWIKEGRAYPVRREPLDHEKEYQTLHVDTLSRLAHQYYGDASYWDELYKANEDRLADPHSLPSGTKLRLPSLEELKQY
jgi:phage tail protein X